MTVQLVGSGEMARVLQVSPDSVRRLAEAGDIPGIRVGKFWRFDADDVIAHLKARTERRDPWTRPAAARRALGRRKAA